MFSLSGTSGGKAAEVKNLHNDMLIRRAQAFRPGTASNHRTQIELFTTFCVYINVDHINPSSETLCLYIEYLAQNLSSPQSVANYFSGVRTLHKYLQQDCPALDSFEVSLMLRACNLTMYNRPLQRLPITMDILNHVVQATSNLGLEGKVFKCAVLFGYYGFLRQSNFSVASARDFDSTRHTCRQDIFFSPPGIVILIKWSKTSQTSQSHQLVPIPEIPGSHLCPVEAYRDMVNHIPTVHKDQPLLVLPDHITGKYQPVTSRWLANFLDVTLETLGYDSKLYSLHSLRRGGATESYRQSVDFLHIKRHGGWSSDAFWGYITSPSLSDSPVSAALASKAVSVK